MKAKSIVTLDGVARSYVIIPIDLNLDYNKEAKKYLKQYPNLKASLKRIKLNRDVKIGTIFKLYGFDKDRNRQGLVFMVTHANTKTKHNSRGLTTTLDLFNVKYRDLVITSITFPINFFGVYQGNHKKFKALVKDMTSSMLIDIEYFSTTP